MRIKYSPQKADYDTVIRYIDENTISIDGEEHSFDSESISWPNIAVETNYAIMEARREDGELFLTVLRQYSSSWQEWYSAEYQEIKA